MFHPSTAPSWAEQDSEQAVLQEGTQASLLPIFLEFFLFYFVCLFPFGIVLFEFVCLLWLLLCGVWFGGFFFFVILLCFV